MYLPFIVGKPVQLLIITTNHHVKHECATTNNIALTIPLQCFRSFGAMSYARLFRQKMTSQWTRFVPWETPSPTKKQCKPSSRRGKAMKYLSIGAVQGRPEKQRLEITLRWQWMNVFVCDRDRPSTAVNTRRSQSACNPIHDDGGSFSNAYRAKWPADKSFALIWRKQ